VSPGSERSGVGIDRAQSRSQGASSPTTIRCRPPCMRRPRARLCA